MKTYQYKNIKVYPEVLKRIKIAAAKEGMSILDFMSKLIGKWEEQ